MGWSMMRWGIGMAWAPGIAHLQEGKASITESSQVSCSPCRVTLLIGTVCNLTGFLGLWAAATG